MGQTNVYGYCRVSTKKQSIERQIANIKEQYPDAKIYEDKFTGTRIDGRAAFERLRRVVRSGDTIVFDEVSRMSRNADEGFSLYKEWYEKGVNLVFLKEPHINTDTYKAERGRLLDLAITTGDNATDELIRAITKALNQYIMALAEKQIQLAFRQAQKEVDYLRQRTKEGMEKARELDPSRSPGRPGGKTYQTQKAMAAKKFILQHDKQFNPNSTFRSNEEVWTCAGISKMSYYKYKRELEQEKNIP